jgi:plastocyanin
MVHRRLRQFLMVVPIALLVIVGMPTSAAAGPDQRTVRASDDCDAATFNAVLDPAGTADPQPCLGDGETTFSDFLAQLAANGPKPNRAAKDWAFSRTNTDIDPGGILTVNNVGGEFHTFTRVAAFGGGCVDVLNQILGLTPVPECANFPLLARTTGIPSGGTLTVTSPQSGVQHYQCLIHPWMHTTVTVEK